MLTIASLGDDTRGPAAALFVEAYPNRAGEVAEWTSNPDRHWAALADDVVGYAAVWRVRAAKFRIDVVVAPGRRRRGVGSALLERMIELARQGGARTVQVRADGATRAGVDSLRRRGFTETMTMYRLVLVLADARHAAHRGVCERLAAEGISIVPLSALPASEAIARYTDVLVAARDGWPNDDPDGPGDPPAMIDWEAIVVTHEPDHGRALIAECGGLVVGFCGAIGTGVRPAWRGRGVATALKVRAIEAAIARGDTVLTTNTGSPPMQHVNEKLGFRETGSEVRLVLRLS